MPPRLAAGLVDDQVAVVERLEPEEVEAEVGGRVERRGEPIEVVAEQRRIDTADLDAALERRPQRPAVRISKPATPSRRMSQSSVSS